MGVGERIGMRSADQEVGRRFAAPSGARTIAPGGRRLALAGAYAAMALVALAFFAHRMPYFDSDLAVTRLVQSLHAGWFDLMYTPLNTLGFPPLVGIVYGSVTLLILAAGARWEAAAAAFAAIGASGLNALVKEVVARPRPSADLVQVSHHLPGFSFPAGHVLNFTAFAGFLCYLLIVRVAPSYRRTALIALFVTMIAAMGVARIDAGEHWPSDVLGGYLLGFAWLTATIEFYRWGVRRSRRGTLAVSAERVIA